MAAVAALGCVRVSMMLNMSDFVVFEILGRQCFHTDNATSPLNKDTVLNNVRMRHTFPYTNILEGQPLSLG